jgi:hypothetical protein
VTKQQKESFKNWASQNPEKTLADVYDHHKEWISTRILVYSTNTSFTACISFISLSMFVIYF